MILFIDFVCPKPYDPRVLLKEPLGGTEATVIRIAEGLAKQDVEIAVLQHNRRTHEKFGANYYGITGIPLLNPTHVIVLRQTMLIPFLRKQWPKAKLYLWCHDLANDTLVHDIPILLDCGTQLVCVSNFHKQNIIERVKSLTNMTEELPLDVLYNPVDDDCITTVNTAVNQNKLVFFSSPHKGYEQTLNMFSCLKFRNPKLELYVANPGYMPNGDTNHPGVVNLGQLKHADMIRHVRGAFCVFYPNTIFPETFGLVYAEANAVGTPVLAHDFGSAEEVLNPARLQLVNCKEIKPVVDRFEAWYTYGRPVVEGKPEFKLAEVIKSWTNLLS